MIHAQLDVLDQAGGVAYSFPISTERVTIGRGTDAEIAINDPGISRLHAVLVRGDAGYLLATIKSANLIWIDGKRVAQTTLVDGARFCLGTTWFAFRVDLRAAATLHIPAPPPDPGRREQRRAETAPVAEPAPAPRQAQPRPRRRLASVVVVLAVVGLVIGGGVFAYLAARKGGSRAAVPWKRSTPYDPFASLPSGGPIDLGAGGKVKPPAAPGLEQVELLVPPKTGEPGDSVPIQISLAPPRDLRQTALPGAKYLRTAGPAIQLEPSGRRFETPVLLRLPYDANIPEHLLAAAVMSVGPDGSERWERYEVFLDRAANVAVVELHHFSVSVMIADPARWAWNGAKEWVAGALKDVKDVAVDKASTVWGYTKDGYKAWNREPPPRDANFISERCRKIRDIIDGRNDRPLAISDEAAFWEALNFNVPGHRSYSLSDYLIKEDGVVEPLRSGREPQLFKRIKDWVRTAKPDQRLSTEDVLALAIDSVAVGNRANLQLAMLTAHNVMRILARPQQWISSLPGDYGHPRSDPATAIFDDLAGKHGAYGEQPLADLMRSQGRVTKTDAQWSMQLFAREPGGTGIFEALPDTTNTSDNAGSHYYFWVGSFSNLMIGPGAAGLGIEREKTTKAEQGIGQIGVIQGRNAYMGVDLGSCIWSHLERTDVDLLEAEKRIEDTAKREAATKDQPCPPRVRHTTKCPWSPDGYEVKECDVGFCFDAGFNHTLACKQIETPSFAYRNDLDNLLCPPGFEMIGERCTGIAVGCRPIPPAK